MSEDLIVLFADNVMYTCSNDEDAFFGWLNKIACVEKVQGVGRRLEITIDQSKVDRFALLDLIGLFYRYNIDLKQFAHHFRHVKFKQDIDQPDAYWRQRMYG